MSRGVCGQCGELYSDDFPCECMTPPPSPAPRCNGPFGVEEECPVHGEEIRKARCGHNIPSPAPERMSEEVRGASQQDVSSASSVNPSPATAGRPAPERMSDEEFDRAIDSAEDGYCLALIDEAERARESESDYMNAAAAEASERRRAHAEIAALIEENDHLRGAQDRADKAEAERDEARKDSRACHLIHLDERARAEKAEGDFESARKDFERAKKIADALIDALRIAIRDPGLSPATAGFLEAAARAARKIAEDGAAE